MLEPMLVRAAADLARIPDPGAREAGAVELLPDALLELPDVFLSDAIDLVAEAPGGRDLLAGMAVAGPTPVAVHARALLQELPDAPAGLGRLRVEQAWELDADEPVVGLFLLSSRAGASGKQLFSFVVETPVSGGAIKDGFVTGTSEGTRVAKRVSGSLPEDTEAREIDPTKAFDRVVAAALRGARSGLAPSPDGLRALTVFLRAAEVDDADAIVQALELGESLPDRVEHLEDEARAAAVSALAAEAQGWLSGRGHSRERAEAGAFATGLMGDFRAFTLDADLTGWELEDLDEFLLDWVPRKVSLADDEVAAFPDAVADSLRFLGATERLDAAKAERLAEQARAMQSDFAEAVVDSAPAGPSKLLLDAMRADGVEVGDRDAMQAWLEDFNAHPFESETASSGRRCRLPRGRRSGRRGRRNARRSARRGGGTASADSSQVHGRARPLRQVCVGRALEEVREGDPIATDDEAAVDAVALRKGGEARASLSPGAALHLERRDLAAASDHVVDLVVALAPPAHLQPGIDEVRSDSRLDETTPERAVCSRLLEGSA